MCRIEQFDIVYRDGSREGRENIRPCHRGTRNQPCTHREVVRLGDHLPSPSDLRNPAPPHIVPIAPMHWETSQPHSTRRARTRDPDEGLSLNLKFWNPFSPNSRREKKQYFFVRKIKKREPRPNIVQPYPPAPPPPPPIHFDPPVREENPRVIPMEPPRDHNNHPPIIHQLIEEDEDGSSSPPEANRDHGRRARSLSPHSRFLSSRSRLEYENELLRELVNRREEREARERAERLHNEERQRARDERREAQRRANEREARHRERARIRREEQEREQEEREQQLREQQLREREERDRERERANRQRHREARARRQQEEEDIERFRAAERERLWRLDQEAIYQEQQRRARARQANIPRDPHHRVFVHRDGDRIDRGDRFIRDGIREHDLRQFEMRARRAGHVYDDGGVRRRNTVDGGQRWYDGQRQRWRDWR